MTISLPFWHNRQRPSWRGQRRQRREDQKFQSCSYFFPEGIEFYCSKSIRNELLLWSRTEKNTELLRLPFFHSRELFNSVFHVDQNHAFWDLTYQGKNKVPREGQGISSNTMLSDVKKHEDMNEFKCSLRLCHRAASSPRTVLLVCLFWVISGQSGVTEELKCPSLETFCLEHFLLHNQWHSSTCRHFLS